jgi:uncharacterized metal-binding protein
MPSLPKKKVGLIACSGEDLPVGTVSRVATLQVLEKLRPEDTVTLCLPLFLAGEERERAFARFYPTIAIDGCGKRCAARATEKYSALPAVSLVIDDLITKKGLPEPRGLRQLNADGESVAQAVAQELAREVDRLLEKKRGADAMVETPLVADESEPEDLVVATCSCGSGIPVAQLHVNGHRVEVLALPVILAKFREMGKPANEVTAGELMEEVKIYNHVPDDEEAGWREAVLRDYARFTAGAELAGTTN